MPETHTEDTQPQPKQLSVTEKGQLSLNTLDEMLNWGQKLIDLKVISETFKTPSQIVIGMQYAKSLKLDPLPALKMMYVLRGTPCLFGDAPLILCRRSGQVSYWREYFVDSDFKELCPQNKNMSSPVWAAVTEAKRKGEEGIQIDYFSIDDAAKANLMGSNNYKKYLKDMIRYKCRTRTLKSKFADLLNGIDIAEWNFNSLPEQGYEEPIKGDDVNEDFRKESKVESKPSDIQAN